MANAEQGTERIGATGNHPAHPSDKRQINIVISADIARQVVVMEFGAPIKSLELTREEAGDMAAALRRRAWALSFASPAGVTAHVGQREVERDDPAE